MLVKAVNNQYVNYAGEEVEIVDTDMAVSFPLIEQQFGKYIRISDDKTKISINLPGTYRVHYNATIANTEASPKVVSSRLQADGKDVVGGASAMTVGASEFGTLSFTTSITVPCDCCGDKRKVLSVINTNDPMAYQVRSILIERVNKRV